MHQSSSSVSHTSDLERPDLYFNRELSWIEFNRRVLEEAQDARHPLLERVKFLSIFDTNLDEFIMVRLAGLKDLLAAHVSSLTPDGRTAAQTLEAVRMSLAPLVQEARRYWRSELMPLLAAHHIYVLDYEQLDADQRESVRAYFEREVFPVLTPLAVDPGHPFPHISNRSLNLAVALSEDRFARVKVPPSLPRLVPVPIHQTEAVAFVWLEQVIAAHLSMLFPGFDVWETYAFRVLRDADIEIREDESSDLLESIEKGLRERRFGAVVDLAVNPSMPQRIRALLLENLEIGEDDLTIIDGPLGLVDMIELHHLDRPELKDTPFIPRRQAAFQKSTDLFTAIQERDLLMHHPYDTFDSIVEFIRAAAHDPQVLAIKQTLYRVGGSGSPVVTALLEAVELGKQVAVLVELKARFDEENNIEWARALEQAGVHVVYGLIGLKTHAKIALVVRREAEGLRRYVHLGTGNYNATTARIYEDLCLLTCHPDMGADASLLFNSLTGYARHSEYRRLLVAPLYLRRGVLERIEREVEQHQQHGNGYIALKLNALVDAEIIRALYRASRAGVRIDLIVRGICCLRPGLAGISETIRVRSLVGRFLEHSRFFYFANGGQEALYLGSADMMQRNLDGRVETLFPIEDPTLRAAVLERVLKPLLADTVNARELRSDGSYARITPGPGDAPFDSQSWFIAHPLSGPDPEPKDQVMSALL